MRQARAAIGLLLAALLLLAGGPGFRSRRQFEEHFAKHGREFGNITADEYLHRAQELRDAPAGGPILEIVKPDGVITRFDKRSGAFGAYNRDRTIRTFFKPNDGERYFPPSGGAPMTVDEYLRENGYPEHVVREGRSGLVRKWREFVEQVERGYPLGLEDYRNDLDVRAILAQAGAEDDEIHALDERFRKLLIHCEKRVWESAPGDPFWDFGYPKNAGADLLEDLREQR